MLKILQVLLRTDAADDRVHRILVETLYTQPASLALGAIAGALGCLPAVLYSGEPMILCLAIAQTLIGIARAIMACMPAARQGRSTLVMEMMFEFGAFSYALCWGLVAALAIEYDVPAAARTLTVVYATAYGAAVAARNAGRPYIAIGQLGLLVVPELLVSAFKPDLADRLFAVCSTLLLLAMISVTRSTFTALRDSIASAETSARLADKMQHLARTDVVTGLLNRAGLNHQLVERVAAIQPDQKLALFWIDLDRFKEVNDTLGHQVGDRLLCEIGSRLKRFAPNAASVARFGGDEFIIACEAASRREVESMAMQLLEAITQPIRIDDDRLEIGSSIGVAILPDDGSDIEAVMQGADLALYHAKVNGRKQVSFFAPSMTRDLVRRKEIEAELRLALQRDELSIFFQPIIDLATGRIRAFEALVRWFHPEKGELRPDEFIPVAEETGAIITLGNWITAQAARVAATWPEDVTIAVNLSPIQIRAPGAALGILNALREARLSPSRLELEITETVLLDNSPNTDAFIAELAEAGVRFALDDFGTGYSSLGYLSKYPFSKIKVDRSFVSGVNAGKKSDAIIRAVSGMGSTLGMEIVAEGIETIDQVKAVRAAGCTLGQGYYFSRAVPDYLAAMLLAQESEAQVGRRLAG